MKVAPLAIAAALALGATAATAASVASNLFSGFQQLSDNSAESLHVDQNGNGKLDQGDVLRGIFTIETVEQGGNKNFLGIPGENELTGVFEVVVSNVTQQVPGLNFGNYLYTFAPTVAFQNAYGVGAMIAFFDDPSNDYTRTGCATEAACEATATNGTSFFTMGIAGAQNFWVANAITNDISVIGGIPAPGNGGTFNIGLDILTQGPASASLTFGKVDCTKLETQQVAPGAFAQVPVGVQQVSACASGSLLGTGGVDTPYDSFNNVDFTLNVIPEPTSLALVGLAMVGLGFARRNRG